MKEEKFIEILQISNHKKSLENNFDWVGKQYKNGLFGDIERLKINLNKSFLLNLLM